MRFYSLRSGELNKTAELQPQFDAGHQIGAVCVGADYLFLKKGLRTYYVRYDETDRIYRRVRTVTANVCCEGGEFRFDYLVIDVGGRERMEIQLPGQKAAQMLLGEIREAFPSGVFEAPERPKEEAEGEASAPAKR